MFAHKTVSSRSLRWMAVLAAISIQAGIAVAEVKYTVEIRPDAGILHVTMVIPGTGKGSLLQIPNWGPGGYRLNDNFTHVDNLSATGPDGKRLSIEQAITPQPKVYQDGDTFKVAANKVCTWIVQAAGSTTVQYDVASRLSDGSIHWGGPATYLYDISHLKDKCRLTIKAPKGWPVYTGLVETKPGSFEYTAKTYDELADNPVSTGDLTVDTYVSRGKNHYIVMRGASRKNVDRAKLLKACKFVTDMETDFFGDSAPYDHYVWHFAVTAAADGAGGLEHLASTEISLAQGVGPRCVDVLAHEFFHLWNVKRIRSKVLGPFDYTQLPETGAIWWLEGVTDYYAFTLLHRYGWTDDKSYFDSIASNLQTVRRNAAHTEIGPNESSMRVAEDSSGRGNSNGYHISYYNLGWLAGMSLDIELRSATSGKHTLDDVEHALWQLCKDDKPGFGEDEIRKQLVKLGGDAFDPIYGRVVMWPDGMKLEETLNKVGLQVIAKPEEFVDLGFTFGGGFGASTPKITTVKGPASGKLEIGDELLTVNGIEPEGDTVRAVIASLTRETRNAMAGKPLALTVRRGGKTLKVEVTPAKATRSLYSVERLANPDAKQKQLGDAWLAKIAFKP